MRVFLALLLCFAIAFQGSVSAHTVQMPCPMGYDGSPSMAVDDHVQAVGDCCNDTDTVAKTGKLCKADTPCGSLSAFAVPAFHAYIPSAQASDPVSALTALVASFDPPGVWRPPSLS